MKQQENPTNQPTSEDDVEKAVRQMEDEDGGKKVPEVRSSKADKSSVKVHTTKPIDQSLAKIKAHRKPRKKAEVGKEGNENAENKNDARRSDGGKTGDSTDAGTGRGGFVLPIDLFRTGKS